jgi:hypothetical protein
MAIEGDPNQSHVILTPEPASPTAEALGVLASWTGDTSSAPRTPARTLRTDVPRACRSARKRADGNDGCPTLGSGLHVEIRQDDRPGGSRPRRTRIEGTQ